MARTGRPPKPLELTRRLGPERQAHVLRRAHSAAWSYRYHKLPMPPRIAELEREYWRWRRREQRKAVP